MDWRDRLADFLETAEDRLGRHALFLLAWLLLLWGIEWADVTLNLGVDRWGIQPHTMRGLAGIFFAPFLHAGFEHLAMNSVTLMALAWLTLLTGWRPFWTTTFLAIAGSGLAVWLTGREETIHLGCSALCFGYLGYLLLHGVLQRSLAWLVVSGAVAAAYGSSIVGLLRQGAVEISWEGHLFGLIFGMIAAALPNPRP